MDKTDFKIGQTVYIKPSMPRRDGALFTEATVTKVGRKYVTVKSDCRLESQFDIATGKEKVDYQPGTLYLSKEDIEDEMLASTLTSKIKDALKFKRMLPLDQAQAIAEILGIEP